MDQKTLDEMIDEEFNALKDIVGTKGLLRVELSPDRKRLYWFEAETGRRLMNEPVEKFLAIDRTSLKQDSDKDNG